VPAAVWHSPALPALCCLGGQQFLGRGAAFPCLFLFMQNLPLGGSAESALPASPVMCAFTIAGAHSGGYGLRALPWMIKLPCSLDKGVLGSLRCCCLFLSPDLYRVQRLLAATYTLPPAAATCLRTFTLNCAPLCALLFQALPLTLHYLALSFSATLVLEEEDTLLPCALLPPCLHCYSWRRWEGSIAGLFLLRTLAARFSCVQTRYLSRLTARLRAARAPQNCA